VEDLEKVLVKQKKWLLFALLLVVMFVLSGCGVPYEGVDVRATAPDGFWQTVVVWPLARALLWLNDTFQGAGVPYHWGFAIIAFTLLVKVVTFPLTISQMRGMQAQKELQPKIQELQKKYGKDREKMAQEQMKLYQEAGVNPLSGCLPMLIQMPVLFGLYAALVAIGPSLHNANFFWIPDLGFPKYSDGLNWITNLFSQGAYLLLVGYMILPILLIVTQFIMQKWMTVTTPSSDDSQAKMMQQMSLMMTVMFGFFTLQVPSGLTLYWVISNLLQMLQQWLITNDRFNLTGVKSTPAAVGAGGNTLKLTGSDAGDAASAPRSAESEKITAPAAEQKRRRAKRK
jgi:YidC/Oxa1 family membrane protein insertase